VALPDGTTVTTEARITYSQNWPAYNAAQCDEKHRVQLLLRGLCDGIVQPPHEGRSRKPALRGRGVRGDDEGLRHDERAALDRRRAGVR
jgi:hypothetical protein